MIGCKRLLNLAAAVQVPADSIAADVEEVRDRALRYSLENGVAFLHKTLSAPDQAAVRRLFDSGAVQVRATRLHPHRDPTPPSTLNIIPGYCSATGCGRLSKGAACVDTPPLSKH